MLDDNGECNFKVVGELSLLIFQDWGCMPLYWQYVLCSVRTPILVCHRQPTLMRFHSNGAVAVRP